MQIWFNTTRIALELSDTQMTIGISLQFRNFNHSLIERPLWRQPFTRPIQMHAHTIPLSIVN